MKLKNQFYFSERAFLRTIWCVIYANAVNGEINIDQLDTGSNFDCCTNADTEIRTSKIAKISIAYFLSERMILF